MNKIHERIYLLRGNLTQEEFAGKLKVILGTYRSYEKGSTKPNLSFIIKVAEKLNVSLDWLVFGRGEQYIKKSQLICDNHKGLLIGGLLQHVFDFLGLDITKIAKKTKIPIERLEILLKSADTPTFHELEALFIKLHINARFLFDGNKHYMHTPTDPLLRVYYALGWQGKFPTYRHIERIFGVSKDEAKEFYIEWKEARENGSERTLPPYWLEGLEENHDFAVSWIMSDDPPFMRARKEQHDSKLFEKYEDVLKENADLREKLAAITGEAKPVLKRA